MPIIPITGTLDLDESLLSEGGIPVDGLTIGLSLHPSTPNEPPATTTTTTTPAPVDPEFAYDTFTDVAGILLQNHTPEKGGPWVIRAGSAIISNLGRLRRGTADTIATMSALPTGPDYEVSADMVYRGAASSKSAAIIARYDELTGHYYRFAYENGNLRWNLVHFDGTQVSLGVSGQTLEFNQAYRMALRTVGDQIIGSVDDIDVITVTDATLSDAGLAGVLFSGTSTDVSGLHLDNFRAINL